ncbi:ClC family H(+)/Cl(-) exchange transporter [Alloscardovia theropitheci]
MASYRTHIQELLSGSYRRQWSIAARGIVCGIAAGLLVVAYRAAIAYGNSWSVGLYAYLAAHPFMICLWVVAAILAAILIAKLIAWEPMASGSGIPQVEGVLLWGLKMRWWSILIVRFTAGIICGFFGMSLGREGPSIQIGAASAAGATSRIERNAIERDNFIAAGAAAGLSAAFSAPLSGMMFALEEVYKSFNPTVLFTATTAALTADLVSKIFLGFTPVLQFANVEQLDLHTYIWLIPLGIVSGLIGSATNKMLLGTQSLYNRIPSIWRILIALAIALPVGMVFPLALGGGASLIQYAEQAGGTILVLASLLAVKMLFTSTSFGSGVPGGIFLPILTIGAVGGSLFARIAGLYDLGDFSVLSRYVATFTVLAMAGALAASVKAPITSMLLVIEMTGSLVHMFPVAAVTLIALLVSDILHIEPIYHVLLDRYMEKNSHQENTAADDNNSSHSSEAESGIISLPVELGSSIIGKSISDITWPRGTSVIAIRRRGKEFVPHKQTVIFPGDGLVVIVPGTDYKKTSEEIRALCSSVY